MKSRRNPQKIFGGESALYYSIKQVSEKINLPAYTLRYYEKEGLLPCISRSRGGIRRFTEEDLDWLSLICCLKSTGMPIRRIREFVDLSRQGEQTLQQRCKILMEHRKNVEERMASMEKQLQKVDCKIRCFSSQYKAYCGRKAT